MYRRTKQKGGSCGGYSLISDAFPSQTDVVTEVKSIMDASLKGTEPMTQAEAAKTSEVVVDTVKEVVPGISPGKIQDVVMNSISKNNVQMGGKPLRKRTTRKKTTATKKKTTTKRKTTTKKKTIKKK